MGKLWPKVLVTSGLAWCLVGLVVLLSWGFFGDLDLSPFVILLFVVAIGGGVAQYLLWVLDLPWLETRLGNIAGFVVAVLAVTVPGVLAIYGLRWIGSGRVMSRR